MIIKCNCKHEFQDETYGKAMRVAIDVKTKSGGLIHRCTVCGKEQAGVQQTRKK